MLTPGTRLGPYAIEAPLGAGGMGEVYRARDTRLERAVAIKILPEHLAGDARARQRFEREAKAISSLNHPHICTLHDVGEQDGTAYLVMECLEGETLAVRLAKGRLPVDQALKIATEVLDALDKAHRQGLIHRDLKPGNVMLTKVGAKLLDFGLAKPMTAPLGGGSRPPALSPGVPSSPTMTVADLASSASPVTQRGTIVGTFQYVAPEVLQGHEADARSDLFGFGCVLYEMLTGKPAFAGKSQLSVLTAILESEPVPPSALLPALPRALDQVVRACLAKDPEDRLQTAHDARLHLQWVRDAAPRPSPEAAKGRAPRAWVTALATGLAVLALAAGWWAGARRSDVPAPAYQFEMRAPGKTVFNFRGLSGPPAISPDGRQMLFVAGNPGEPGSGMVWLRSFDSTEARALPGTEQAAYPFWSPDGRSFAFFSDGKLRKYDLGTGMAIALCDVAEGRGGAWMKNGTIIFGNRDRGLVRVSAAGGEAVDVTTPDVARQESNHRWPTLLPDEKHVLFMAQGGDPQLYVVSLDDPKPAPIPGVKTQAFYAEGHLLYVSGTTLMARPFDWQRLQFTGEPQVIAEHVQDDLQFNFAVFSASGPFLAYQTGAIPSEARIATLDRDGHETVLYREQVLMPEVHLSPSGDRLLVTVGLARAATDVWVYGLSRQGRTRLTFDQRSNSAVWSPDGERVAFSRTAAAGYEVAIKGATGSGPEEVVFADKSARALDLYGWSPDGYLVAIIRRDAAEVCAIPVRGGAGPICPMTSGPAPERPALSSDGRWLAYASGSHGLKEVFVVPFRPGAPAGSSQGKWQISSGGGNAPAWRGDGGELFLTNVSTTTLYSTLIDAAGEDFRNDPPRRLFDLGTHTASTFYAVSRDGRSIYISNYGPGSTEPITVTVNWPRLLQR